MSHKIITASEQVELAQGQAVIMITIDNGRGYVWLSHGDRYVSSIRQIACEFVIDNVDSINEDIDAAVELAEKQGLTLLEENELELMAKKMAVTSVMSSHSEADWEYAYYQAYGEGNCGWQSFNRSSMSLLDDIHDGICYSVLSELLEAKFDSLMGFAREVVKLQSKKWLVKSAYKGFPVDAFVVTGPQEEVKNEVLWHANKIAGVNEMHKQDKSKWTFQNYDELMAHIGLNDYEDNSFWADHDCATIHLLSIEEI